jgi:hypothetical protein
MLALSGIASIVLGVLLLIRPGAGAVGLALVSASYAIVCSSPRLAPEAAQTPRAIGRV